MERIKGLDISHYQGTNFQFGEAKKADNQFFYVKCTQGIAGSDPIYHHNIEKALAAGVPVGSYHFFDAHANPITQAQLFVAHALIQKGSLVPMLDIELTPIGKGKMLAPTVADVQLCVTKIKSLTGYYPILYFPKSLYVEQFIHAFPSDQYTIWIAEYGAEPTIPNIAFWQFSQSVTIAAEGDVNIDGDYYYGTLEDLLAKHSIK